jgi:uncharacterized membrane protein YphA (DoxX/SURF4 family)
MAEQLIATPEPMIRPAEAWSLKRPIAFRFCFVYFILFSLSNQIVDSIFIVPKIDVPDPASMWPFRLGVLWVGRHILGIKTAFVYQDTGSGDRLFDWVLIFCLLAVAVIATAVWSWLDRRRTSYPVLSKWFLLFLRVALASQMLVYGSAKFIPLQMAFPHLFKLVEPLRNFSPMGVLWTSVGASPAYEIFTGGAELIAGFLLIFPRTATIGALVAMADMTQVFVLNMTYDVPVKLLSFHLIVMSLLFIAPNIQQLFNFFFRSQPATLAAPEPLFHSPRANRIVRVALVALWLWMIGVNSYNDWDGWRLYGQGRPHSALAGIWSIQQFSIDGQPQPLSANNSDEWRRVIFDFVDFAHIQHMDDSLTGYAAALDTQKQTLALTTASNKNWRADFTFSRPAKDELLLDGTVNGHKQHIELKLMDMTKFTLTSRGFHWVQDYPFNR